MGTTSRWSRSKDCDILNDEIHVAVAELTDKSECIKELYLDIEGEEMGRNTAGRKGSEGMMKSQRKVKLLNLNHIYLV